MATDRAKTAFRVCARCVLPETFPGISFDAEGVCNYCLEAAPASEYENKKREYRARFEKLIEENKSPGGYDILMCYSGGKDSTYTLSLLKEKYGLNILAFTLDNGFVSPMTIDNIRAVVEKLGVDHIYFKPSFATLSRIFKRCAEQSIFPSKCIERASDICTACMAIVKYAALRQAVEKSIPMVGFGWSPGQAPLASSVMKNNPRMVRLTMRTLFDPLYRVAGEAVLPFFLEERHFSGDLPYFVHPLAFLDYDEDTIYGTISRLGWHRPRGLDANSTNCLLNSLANIVHRERHGFNPYSFEMANLVRAGCVSREVALNKLNEAEDPATVQAVQRKLDSGAKNG